MILFKEQKTESENFSFDHFRLFQNLVFLFAFKQLIFTCLMDAQVLHKSFHAEIELFHFHFALSLNRMNFHFWENTALLTGSEIKKEVHVSRKGKPKNVWVSSGCTLSAIVLVNFMKALKKKQILELKLMKRLQGLKLWQITVYEGKLSYHKWIIKRNESECLQQTCITLILWCM